MRPDSVIGWDIGGAHVKVALANTAKSITQIHQLPCQLWLGLDQLRASIATVQKKFDLSHSVHAITMTGELVDYFSNREDGVARLVKEMTRNLPASRINYFAGNKGFISSEEAIYAPAEVASANWLASANYSAAQIANALFIDIGSTTSDVIRITDHKVTVDGYSDAERLYARELVYCGVVRTPVFALCKSAPLSADQAGTNTRFMPVINEYFANAADVYRITEELPAHADIGETPDSRDKNLVNSVARLARMFGHDANGEELLVWRRIANYVREQQLQMIINACRKQISKITQPLEISIIGAGVGRFLIREIARRLNRQYIDFTSLINYENSSIEFDAADCAPAASVACLAYQRFCL